MNTPGARESGRTLRPALGIGVQNTLNVLSDICTVLLRGYSTFGARLDHLVGSVRELQHVDRLLSVLTSSAGALESEPISRLAWPLVLTRSCLQTFLLRLLYDAGVRHGLGVDPGVRVVSDASVRSTMSEVDVAKARGTLGVLFEKLQRLSSLLVATEVDTADAPEFETPIVEDVLIDAFQDLEASSRLILRNLSQWMIGKERRRPTAELGLLNDSSREDLSVLLEWFVELDLSKRRGNLERDLAKLCRDVMSSFEYELCGVQFVRPGGVIETVIGAGMASHMVGLARHRLAIEKELRDIQADIVMERKVEVIRGADRRFDEFLYFAYGHSALVRVFVPIVVFRNRDGSIVSTPPSDCWSVAYDSADKDGRVVLTLRPLPDLTPEVIGTVEAGFTFVELRDHIPAGEAAQLAQRVTDLAPTFYENTVERALERALQRFAELTRAGVAVLQLFDDDPDADPVHSFIQQSGKTQSMLQIVEKISLAPPALRDSAGSGPLGTEGYIPFPNVAFGETIDDVKRAFPPLYEFGIRNIVAFPISFGRRRGLFSALFTDIKPKKSDLAAAALLVHRYRDIFGAAEDAREARDRLRQLLAQSEAFRRLKSPNLPTSEIEFGISWIALNVFAADLVTVQWMAQGANWEESPPCVAGRLISRETVSVVMSDDDIRRRVFEAPDAIWAEDAQNSLELMVFDRRQEQPRFIERERIESLAAIPLRVKDRRVGVMFISFRSRRFFSDDDREFIQSFCAASAALLESSPHDRAGVLLEFALAVTYRQLAFSPGAKLSFPRADATVADSSKKHN